MKTISQAEQALAELAAEFTDWRRRRGGRHERIPAPLWDQAVALSRVLPNGRVAKALKLSATDLKPAAWRSSRPPRRARRPRPLRRLSR